MLVYLFAEVHPTGRGYLIRPVPWAKPETKTVPVWLEKTPDAVQWLADHGWPEWKPHFNGVNNCKRLAIRLGHWPQPFNATGLIELEKADINDPIPFEDSQGTARIDREFQQFHKQNPQVFDLFWVFALEALNAGREHFGAKAIFERIRWHVEVETRSGDAFKLNNNYSSRYARLLEKTDQRFAGFFQKRKLKG